MKNRLYIYVLLYFSIFSLSSCITTKQKNYLQDENSTGKYQSVPYMQYKLNVNDEVTFYLMSANTSIQYMYNGGNVQNGSFFTSNTYRIYEDGCIVLPTLGKMEIAGLTLREAEVKITNAFKNIVVEDAEVKLAIANNFFYVEGDNGKGQFFMYKERLTIFQAMAMAGDISSMGDKKNIKIIRKGIDGIDQIKTLDLRKASIIESEYYYIYPNDVIYIPTNSNSFFRVDSVSSFVSMFLAPISLLIMVLTLFK